MQPEPTIGIIGAGRAGGALALALHEAGWRVVSLYSRAPDAARSLAARIGAVAAATPVDVARGAGLVCIATPDAAIAPVCRAVAEAGGWRAGQGVIHCSGALGREALEAAARCGALTGGFHPLQTLTGPDTAGRLRGAYVALDAGPPLAETLWELAIAIGARPFALHEHDRALYHAAAVMVANYTIALYACGVRLLEIAGLPEDVQTRALLPLVRGAIASLESAAPAEALTGPLARGDVATVARHLAALARRAPELLPLYCGLGRAALELARVQGLPDDSATALARLLEGAPGEDIDG
ncbi:MAG: DUF2520 domain-containing protein [Chloroflexi bacterium]|nr:DUF2520 domain-containing protein [Chloroflexota bacterium]